MFIFAGGNAFAYRAGFAQLIIACCWQRTSTLPPNRDSSDSVSPCSFRLVRGYGRVGPAISLRSPPGRNGASEAGGFRCNVGTLAHVKGDVMAEHPDVALVRRGYAAFSAGDMATLSELLAEDARQYQPGSAAISGEYRGRDAILAFYARLASETNGTFRVVLEGVYTDGEGRVVASSQTTAERGDRRLDTGAALVFTIKDGKAQDVRGFQEDLDVWNDFWS